MVQSTVGRILLTLNQDVRRFLPHWPWRVQPLEYTLHLTVDRHLRLTDHYQLPQSQPRERPQAFAHPSSTPQLRARTKTAPAYARLLLRRFPSTNDMRFCFSQERLQNA